MTRPVRYTENNSNRDWIDEFCATSTADEVRGAFRFTIGKYLRRYGKKDDPLQEALKIQDYANRLVEFERAALMPGAGREFKPSIASDFGQQHTIEPAAAMDDDSPRMQAIGQSGNGGEHYTFGPVAIDGAPMTVAEAIALGGREPQRPRHLCMACGLGHATHECGGGQ